MKKTENMKEMEKIEALRLGVEIRKSPSWRKDNKRILLIIKVKVKVKQFGGNNSIACQDTNATEERILEMQRDK